MVDAKPGSPYDDDNDRDENDGRNDNKNESKNFPLQCCHSLLSLGREFGDFAEDSVITSENTYANTRASNTMSTLHSNAFRLYVNSERGMNNLEEIDACTIDGSCDSIRFSCQD